MPPSYRLERTQFIPKPRGEVFAFFSDAANLERLTPAFLHFEIVSPPPIVVQPDALIDYKLRLYGIPIRWRTRIDAFEPGRAFTDVQLSGPYRRWRHRHEFEDAPGGTTMTDRVEYELPLGPLGSIARLLFVKRSLDRIFDYRARQVAKLFSS